MKKTILIVTFVSLLFSGRAQTENVFSKEISNKLVSLYNRSVYDSIFMMFSEDLKTLLPAKNNTVFFGNLKTQAGEIKNTEFLGYNGNAAIYKVVFESTNMVLNLSGNRDMKITGFQFTPEAKVEIPSLTRNVSSLILPFKGEWDVFWGGDTESQNYHVVSKPQKHAFDFVIRDNNGKSFKNSGRINEDYYAFGAEILAPCDGVVILVVDGVPDNIPGEMNPYYTPGNVILIKTANNEYLFFAHFKEGSIKVKKGQVIKSAELLGLCGNSGNSSEPHLHFHIQDRPDINKAFGVSCLFKNIWVNGIKRNDYSPVKNEKIKN